MSTTSDNFRISVLIFVGAIAFMVLAILADSSYRAYVNGHPARPDVTIPTPTAPPGN